jgi:hypothetical protein
VGTNKVHTDNKEKVESEDTSLYLAARAKAALNWSPNPVFLVGDFTGLGAIPKIPRLGVR